MQQICSIRAVIKGWGLEIFSRYYERDLRLLSQENRGKIELKEINSCLIPHLLLVFNQQLETLVTTALFHYKIPTRKYFSDVLVHSRPHWFRWKNNEKKNNNNRSYSCTLYVGVHVFPLGLSLSFEASIANEDSSVTSHKNLQWHLQLSPLITCNIK